jgi:hypothetical protein
MILIMIPLATTEIGTDGWITGIMDGVTAGKFHSGWILIYHVVHHDGSAVLRGANRHSLSPLGLLTMSAILASLADVPGQAARQHRADLRGGDAVRVRQDVLLADDARRRVRSTPARRALTLNALGGIGMLAVGVLGFPFIGALQANKEDRHDRRHPGRPGGAGPGDQWPTHPGGP